MFRDVISWIAVFCLIRCLKPAPVAAKYEQLQRLHPQGEVTSNLLRLNIT